MSTENFEIVGDAPEAHANPNSIEARARTKGWVPEEEWTGDPDDWVTAKEFVGRQGLFDKIASLKRNIDTLNDTHRKEMQQVSKYVGGLQERMYEKALKELNDAKKLAARDNNQEAIIELDERIEEVKAEQKEAAKDIPQVQTVNPQTQATFNEWLAENSWFNDPDLQKEAMEIGMGHAIANPSKSQKDVLEYTTKRMKELRPEKFGGQRKKPVANSVEDGGITTRSATPKRGDSLSWEDLTEDQKRIGKTIIERGTLKDLAAKNKRSERDEYLAQMADQIKRNPR